MSPALESVFEVFFKYKPFIFEKGRLVLGGSWAGVLAALLLIGIGVIALRRYPAIGGKSTRRDRIVLLSLRVAILGLLLLCLLRPALVVATAVPQQNFVGVLLDDSRSMRIADLEGEARGEFIRSELAAEGGLLDELAARFKLRLFGFSSGAARLESPADLRFAGQRTDLPQALDRVRQELVALPVSAIVLISDGADNAGEGLTETLSMLQDRSIPVFVVGLGAEVFSRDIEIARVDVPREVLAGSSVGADVVIRQRGFDGVSVELFVQNRGQILATQTVDLPVGGDTIVVKVHFLADKAGSGLLSFRVALQEGEMVAQNNEREALVAVRDESVRILYFEGEPRFEVAFMQRALQDDPNLAVVSLVRTADNKFMRKLVDPDERFGGENELFAGFPDTREELYAYSGLILGSVEADFFTPDQLRMIADFVSQRGGGLLTLGGQHSFAGGGYAGTPVADVLPVVLPTQAPQDGSNRPVPYAEIKVSPTLFGLSHPVVQLADTPEDNIERWQALPPLVTVNPMSHTKPGAATLLEGHSDLLAEPQVVLAYQRYGSGKSIVFNVVDSWQWQMHYDIPLDDMTHETLWRQLLRWLVSDVAGQVQARLERDRFEIGEPVELVADVFDDTYLAVNNAQVTARVAGPEGEEHDLVLRWEVEFDGRYTARFTPRREGFYEIQVSALRGSEVLGEDTVTGQATELTHEFFAAEMNRSLLQRVAAETQGRFYTPATVNQLPSDIRFTDGGSTVDEVLDLWDMPIVFVALIVLIGTEWTIRKLRRLA